jgi:hypothetical protein
MKKIERKIYLDDYIYRGYTDLVLSGGTTLKYGDFTTDELYVNVFISQKYDDMGISTNLDYIPKNDTPADYTVLIDKLNSSGYTFQFMTTPNATTFVPEDLSKPYTRYPQKNKSEYQIPGGNLSGKTEDRLDEVASYNSSMVYQPLFDIDKGTFDDYLGNSFELTTSVLDNNNLMPITYVLNGDKNESINLSNPEPQQGVVLRTYSGITREITGTIFADYQIPLTEFYYKAQGFNDTNTVLSAVTKEEYLFGITFTPTVDNDILIDRGINTVFQNHLQLSEIKNMSDLVNYGNGFYNITK